MMYQADTDNISVMVQPQFLDDESDPNTHQYFWAYHVRIENGGQQPIQVIRRHWTIINSYGSRQEIFGDGIVGEQPILQPGEAFEYTSAAPLSTPGGMMLGTYDVSRDGNALMSVTIPAFSLDSPYQSVSIN